MSKNEKNKYTEGRIFSSLIKLSAPIILANLLQTAYQLIDTFWLGRLGANAVAAVSVSFPILMLVISIGAGLTLAGTVLVSQYKGANDQKMVDYISSQNVFLIFLLSICLSLGGYFLSGPLMHLIGAGPDIIEDSISYFKISSLGFVFIFMFFIFQSLMRGIGNVMLPVYVVLSTVLLNLLLDPLFIYGYGPIPAFGISGAAVASVFTQAISGFIGMYILFKGKSGIQIRWESMKLKSEAVGKIMKLGVPSSIEQSTRATGMILMIALVASFGSHVVASYGIGARILSFVVVPALGFAIATTSLIGQNIGAGKLDRAEKVANLSNKIGFYGLSAIGLIFFLFAEHLTAFFVPNEAKVIEDGALFIKIMAPSFGLMGIQQIMNGVFNGAGYTKASMLISILGLWIIRFPLAYLLSNNTSLGFVGIWWSFPISNLITAIVAFVYFKMGRWKKRLIDIERDSIIYQ